MVSRLVLVAILSLKSNAVAGDSPLRGMTPCEFREWHIDIENNSQPGCSNSWKVPSSWRFPGNRNRMFYESSSKCCSELFEGGGCRITDLCECKDGSSESGTCEFNDPRQKAESELRDHCLSGERKWHFDMDTKRGCTNSPRFPDNWKDPDVAVHYFFDTPEGCCHKFTERGLPCPHIDVCRKYRTDNEIEVDLEEVVEKSENATNNKMSLYDV